MCTTDSKNEGGVQRTREAARARHLQLHLNLREALHSESRITFKKQVEGVYTRGMASVQDGTAAKAMASKCGMRVQVGGQRAGNGARPADN